MIQSAEVRFPRIRIGSGKKVRIRIPNTGYSSIKKQAIFKNTNCLCLLPQSILRFFDFQIIANYEKGGGVRGRLPIWMTKHLESINLGPISS